MTTGRRGTPFTLGPAEQLLAETIARRFYFDDRSKIEIAAELGLSRFKVARLLHHARESGIVRIEVGGPTGIDAELSNALRETFGLHHALVASTAETDQGRLRDHVGLIAARLLPEVATDGDVIGMAWGRALAAMQRAITDMPRVTVVQLCGVLADVAGFDDGPVELTRAMAGGSGQRPRTFYAPMVLPDAAGARALRRQPGIREAMAAYRRLTGAWIAIGAWAPGQSTVHDSLPASERRRFAREGTVAEACGILVDAAGRPLQPGIADRVLGIDIDQLRAVPEVVGLAYGDAKVEAVRAAVSGGLVTSLVTHASLARSLLQSGPALRSRWADEQDDLDTDNPT